MSDRLFDVCCMNSAETLTSRLGTSLDHPNLGSLAQGQFEFRLTRSDRARDWDDLQVRLLEL